MQFNDFDQTMGFYQSYTLLFKPPVLMLSCLKLMASMSLVHVLLIGAPQFPTIEEKMEMDARSVHVGNVSCSCKFYCI